MPAAVQALADDAPGDRDITPPEPRADGLVLTPARREMVEHDIPCAFGDFSVRAEHGDGVIVIRLSGTFVAGPYAKILHKHIVRGDDKTRVLEADAATRRSLPGNRQERMQDDHRSLQGDGAADAEDDRARNWVLDGGSQASGAAVRQRGDLNDL